VSDRFSDRQVAFRWPPDARTCDPIPERLLYNCNAARSRTHQQASEDPTAANALSRISGEPARVAHRDSVGPAIVHANQPLANAAEHIPLGQRRPAFVIRNKSLRPRGQDAVRAARPQYELTGTPGTIRYCRQRRKPNSATTANAVSPRSPGLQSGPAANKVAR